jgi:hypothetical protein
MMRVAFHKGGGRWNLFSWAIRTWTRGKYSHVELIFSDNMSFSSRKDGVRFEKIDYKKHPERWDIFPLALGPTDEEVIRAHARKHCGQKYDWVGIVLDRVFGTSIHGEKQWWCSEIVAHVLGIEPEMIDPTQLYNKLQPKEGVC